MASITPLIAAAVQAMQRGDLGQAERLWREATAADPNHPQPPIELALISRARGRLDEAQAMVLTIRASHPSNIAAALLLAQIYRERGDDGAEIKELEAALSIDAYCWPALLQRGQWLERQGLVRKAAQAYQDAIHVAPPPERRGPDYAAAFAHAEQVASHYMVELEDTILRAAESAAGRISPQWREAIAIMAGRTRPYHAVCNKLTVPRLPAIPFHDRAAFPWLPELEAHTDAIRTEMQAAFSSAQDQIVPYIQYRPDQPANQWKALNHSLRWSTFHLWRDGKAVTDNLARCPQTAAALGACDLAEITDYCPNAMFSALAPHTEIPPHTGETNARLVAHLPLIVPDNCHYRVGFDHRQWRIGEGFVFDDTIEHTARNDSDELRVVLIFDVWNPLLSAEERALVNVMMAAARRFNAS
jgi:aspartyl/asparaginyl beta-hydroxylase (cupin superfamily)